MWWPSCHSPVPMYGDFSHHLLKWDRKRSNSLDFLLLMGIIEQEFRNIIRVTGKPSLFIGRTCGDQVLAMYQDLNSLSKCFKMLQLFQFLSFYDNSWTGTRVWHQSNIPIDFSHMSNMWRPSSAHVRWSESCVGITQMAPTLQIFEQWW